LASGVTWPAPVEARIALARQHVTELGKLLGEYVALPPYKLSTRPSEGRLMIDRAEIHVPPPREAAMVVSDAVHQARAALDNLVNALRLAGPPPGVYLPIRTSEPKYDEAIAKGALRGVLNGHAKQFALYSHSRLRTCVDGLASNYPT
jgi:hypothetical protein